jgi:Na+/phosphate symporter
MLSEFFDLFRRRDLLNEAFERSAEMLQDSHKMIEASCRSLREHEDTSVDIDVYAVDQRINAYEREVRRKVFTHLSLSEGEDLNVALILVSIVIDIERLGDFAKNILELAQHHPTRLECGGLEETVREVETTVERMFTIMLDAFPTNDEKLAKQVMEAHWPVARRINERLAAAVAGEEIGLSASAAVATVLYLRYLKRISAHLMNIASSIVNPFERIGFDPRPREEREAAVREPE